MLQTLGRNRIIVLILLALLNAGAGYGLYQYLIPERLVADQDLAKANSELQARRAEIQKLKEEYALLQSQLRYFKELQARGFFNNQGRVEAQESFEKLRAISGVINAKYNISAGQIMDDARATDAGYVILNSPITVDLDSLDDVDVYSFLKLIQERFPGQVDIVEMNIKKVADVDIGILRKIGNGVLVPLVKSTVKFSWRTMASQASLSPDTASESQSSSPQAVPVNPPAATGVKP